MARAMHFERPSSLLHLPDECARLESEFEPHAARWVKSVKEECLSKLILVGEASLKRALEQYLIHFHAERNHQGKGNVLLFPSKGKPEGKKQGTVQCQERLGGLLRYYHREAE